MCGYNVSRVYTSRPRLSNVGRGPAWSPDGSRIAFESFRDGQSEVYVMNADGSGLTRLSGGR